MNFEESTFGNKEFTDTLRMVREVASNVNFKDGSLIQGVYLGEEFSFTYKRPAKKWKRYKRKQK